MLRLPSDLLDLLGCSNAFRCWNRPGPRERLGHPNGNEGVRGICKLLRKSERQNGRGSLLVGCRTHCPKEMGPRLLESRKSRSDADIACVLAKWRLRTDLAIHLAGHVCRLLPERNQLEDRSGGLANVAKKAKRTHEPIKKIDAGIFVHHESRVPEPTRLPSTNSAASWKTAAGEFGPQAITQK